MRNPRWRLLREPIKSKVVDFLIDTMYLIGVVVLGAFLIKRPIGAFEDDSLVKRILALLGIATILWRWAVHGIRPSKQMHERLDAVEDPQEKLDETWQFRRR